MDIELSPIENENKADLKKMLLEYFKETDGSKVVQTKSGEELDYPFLDSYWEDTKRIPLKKYTNNPTLIAASWKDIEQHYTQKNRAYHNLTHLQNMFQELQQYEQHIEDIDVLKFSIWYHDIIYNALKKDNEERSADFAKNILMQTSLAKDRIARCYQQILSTKTHQPIDSTNLDEQLMVDFDLEILSRDWEKYKVYCQQIRKEYWMYPGPLFRKGRKKAMQHFLERPNIYQSSFYQQAKEAQARANIQRELDELL